MISAPTRDPTLGGTLLSLSHDFVRHRSMEDAGESEGGFLENKLDMFRKIDIITLVVYFLSY